MDHASTIRLYGHYGHAPVQRFATKILYTRARATDGSTMLPPMSPGGGKGLKKPPLAHGYFGFLSKLQAPHHTTNGNARLTYGRFVNITNLHTV